MLRLRWFLVIAAALTATAMAECNVTEAEIASASTSASTDWDGSVGEGDDDIFKPEDNGKGCTEEALWCSSLGQALSRDPNNNCEFPECPYYGLRRR
ncbi:hypothetical protein DVH05_027370 [Phytophthora capsici]|nr:hypothetical protein DVH05_027370 [Phytophthora capsici]